MNPQKVIISENLTQSLTAAMEGIAYDRLFILCDENTCQLCLPVLQKSMVTTHLSPITILLIFASTLLGMNAFVSISISLHW